MKKKILVVIYSVLILLFNTRTTFATDYTIKSPNGLLIMTVSVGSTVSYTVKTTSNGGVSLIAPSQISLSLDNGTNVGVNGTVKNVTDTLVNDRIQLLYGQSKSLADNYEETAINFNENYSLICRAYNEGVAYRFVTNMTGNVIVNSEQAQFNFAYTPDVWYSLETNENPRGSTMSEWEQPYKHVNTIQEISAGTYSQTPALFSHPVNGLRVAIGESDVTDYPGMYVQFDGTSNVKGMWAQYPDATNDPTNPYATHNVWTRFNYLAKTTGIRSYPWRVIFVSQTDKDLLDNKLIFKLARAQETTDTDWIQPGRSAWEWWADAITGKTITQALAIYKTYVDFAAANHLEYITCDAGWDTSYAAELCSYAKSKNVKVICWDYYGLLVNNMSRVIQLRSYGFSGIKTDLINRNDQVAMNWIEGIAKNCATQHMALVIHGCPTPSGWERKYPNILNYEAVNGEENDKWNTNSNADYHVQILFMRQLAGPMETTPGSLQNVHLANFQPKGSGLPESIGTRGHELSMYILNDQPMAYLCDTPSNYGKSPEMCDFFSNIPSTYDSTVVLDAKACEFALMAKQKGDNWYVGGMTNSTARTIQVDYSFLPVGEQYSAIVLRDNDNTVNDAKAYTRDSVPNITSASKISYSLAAEGGIAIRLIHTGSISGITPVQVNQVVKIKQNTNRSRLDISTNDGELKCINIFNLSGESIYKKELTVNSSAYSIDTSSFLKGVYVLNVKLKKQNYTTKFLI